MAKTPKQDIPQTQAELTPDWYTRHLKLGTVTAVTHEVVGAGVGFVGELYRAKLTWAEPAGQPPSIIVKVPTQIEANRSVGEGLMAYEREIQVYAQLGDDLGIPMPTYYYSALDPDPAPWMEKVVFFLFEKLPVKGVNWIILQFLKIAGKSKRRYLLAMEDIADARPPTQVAGGSVDDALAALEVLASFHAHNWNRSEVLDTDLRVLPMDQLPKVWQASYLRCREEFGQKFSHVISPEVLARLDEVQENFDKYIQSTASGACTILHGDYRLDNVLFRPDGSLVILDYQLMSWGRAGWDVAYFITTALTPDHRHEEGRLLEHYHRALVAAGVTEYSYDELLHDTQLTKILLAHRMVGSVDTLETETPATEEQDSQSFVDLLVGRVVGWVDPAWTVSG